MNEKIQELLAQAISDVDYIHHDDVIDQELSEMFIPDVFAQRFAELIIQKCITIAYEHNNSGEGGVVAGQINQHFGVE
jgi:hypothetical protein